MSSISNTIIAKQWDELPHTYIIQKDEKTIYKDNLIKSLLSAWFYEVKVDLIEHIGEEVWASQV